MEEVLVLGAHSGDQPSVAAASAPPTRARNCPAEPETTLTTTSESSLVSGVIVTDTVPPTLPRPVAESTPGDSVPFRVGISTGEVAVGAGRSPHFAGT